MAQDKPRWESAEGYRGDSKTPVSKNGEILLCMVRFSFLCEGKMQRAEEVQLSNVQTDR